MGGSATSSANVGNLSTIPRCTPPPAVAELGGVSWPKSKRLGVMFLALGTDWADTDDTEDLPVDDPGVDDGVMIAFPISNGVLQPSIP